MFKNLDEFRNGMTKIKCFEEQGGQTVHLKSVNPKLLGFPETLLEIFTISVEGFYPGDISEQDVVTVNLLLDCFTKVLAHRTNDYQSHQNFREYIRNRLAIRLAKIQLAQRQPANPQ